MGNNEKEKNCSTCEFDGCCICVGQSCGGMGGDYEWNRVWVGYPYWEEKHKKSDNCE